MSARRPFCALPLLLAMACATTSAPHKAHTGDPLSSPNPDRPYGAELSADDPLGAHPLDGKAPGAIGDKGATAFGGDTNLILSTGFFGGIAGSLEIWASEPRGTLLSYAIEGELDALVVQHTDTLKITIHGETHDVGQALGEGWHHLGVAWDAEESRISLSVDGRALWSEKLGQGMPRGGLLVLGQRQGCLGGCFSAGLTGTLDELAIYDRALPTGRFLSHTLVARGLRAPTPRQVDLPLVLTPQIGHSDAVLAIAFSPDSRLMLTASADQSAKLWEVSTGKLVRTLQGHRARVISAAFSPDMRFGLTGDRDMSANLWDLATGETLHHFDDHPAAIEAVAFSPDGRFAVTASPDIPGDAHIDLEEYERDEDTQSLLVWNLATGEKLRHLKGHTDGITDVAFAPDGRLVSSSSDHTVRIWAPDTGESLATLDVYPDKEDSDHPTMIALSPDGKTLATATYLEVDLWHLDTGAKHLRVDRASVSEIFDMDFSPDGQSLLVAVEDGRIHLYEVATGALVGSVRPSREDITSVAFDPNDGERFVFGDESGRLEILPISAFRENKVAPLQRFERQTNHAVTAAWHPDGHTALIGRHEGTLRVWDMASLKETAVLDAHKGEVRAVVFSPDGERFLTGGDDHLVKLWDTRTQRVVREFKGHTAALSAIAFSPDGLKAISGSYDGTARLWDLGTGAEIRVIKGHRKSLASVAFSPDGKRVATSSWDITAAVWDVATGDIVQRFIGEIYGNHDLVGCVRSVVFSPDGTHLLGGSYDGPTFLWAISSGEAIETVESGEGLSDFTTSVAYSPDGRLILRGSSYGSVELLDAKTFDVLAHLQVQRLVTQATFSPDGRHALATSEDGNTYLWHLTENKLVTLTSERGQWLAYTPRGDFASSPGGTDLVAATQGTALFGLDQLSVRHNRPDKVLEHIGLGHETLRGHFEAQHLRRLRRLGLNPDALTSKIDLPSARLLQIDQSGGVVSLRAALRDRVGLGRYQIHVNGVPIYPGGGKAVTGLQALIEADIALGPGPNRIEVSALNTRGMESLRSLREVHHEDATAPDLYLLALGVSRYKNEALNLGFAHQDALDLSAVLGAAKGYGKIHIKTLTDDQVTVANLKAARGFVDGAHPRDTFVLFIAGHGMHDADAAATYYYLTHEANPANLAETAASFELIEDLLSGVAPRQKLFLLDTCESGEAEEAIEATAYAQAERRGLKARTARGFKKKANVGLGNAPGRTSRRTWLTQKDRFIYLDLSRRSGSIVFSSSRGGEFSYESAEAANGFFTDELLKALTSPAADRDGDGRVSTDELRAFIPEAVSARTDGLQNPTVDRDNIHQRFAFPLVLE